MVPEDEVSLRVMRDDLGRGVANEGGGKQQRDDLGGKNLAAAVTLKLGHSTRELNCEVFSSWGQLLLPSPILLGPW